MRNLRYTLSLILAFLTRFKWILLGGVFFGVAFFILISFFGSSLFQSKTEKIGIVGRFRLDNLPYSILNYVSSGLTKIDENGNVTAAISTSWESEDSGKTWIFHLSDDATWQDGKKIFSNDIVVNFSDVVVEKPDPKTVVFKLQTPFSPFPSVLSKPIFRKGLLGTGEWEVEKVRVVGSTVEKLVISKKKEGRITFRFYPTEERAKLALKLGEVDELQDIFNPQPFDSWKVLDVQKKIDNQRFVAVFFNSAKEKITADKTLRQALTYAIDKEALADERALGPISPNSWAYNPQVKPYNFDPERAKELIKDLSKEVQAKLSLNIATTPVLLEKAEAIAKNWRDVGINVNVQVTSSIPEDFDCFLAVLEIPKDPDQYSLWHSSQTATNISNYKSPRIDKLLEDGRTVTSQEERKNIYLDFQRFLVEDSPAAFLYHPESFTITRK